jgi:hypothetical protein
MFMSRLFQVALGLLISASALPAFAAPTPVPEPLSMGLFAVGVGGLVVVRGLRNRKK